MFILLTCEHPGCQSTEGLRDYRRTPEDLAADEEGAMSQDEQEDWKDEPIALCSAHAGSRQHV